MEAMFHTGFDKDHTAGDNRFVLRTNLHVGTTTDNVIHFVFFVRLLRVAAARGQNVKTGAHDRNPQELKVPFAALPALFLDFRNTVKMLH